ncbi:hypothetical protein [Mycolicibacterium brumae]|uniref:SnoaL-like domain-containing protein n=1 Tax=Mycolicibacterium brumae TaxID=85968 RepID=A0A2G5PCB4_9MYCO|nr:hypothetical protein [Mycolicibacterium brumae]MCV7193100.1 hypothetical protein [Mycolicibacterium brumae]PIB75971.1 hypothetical protein CQY22_008000 [Mycolicibacterium brumae]RWA16537.1 hypothetical protein MBRU_07375 [Mycolicibacterium brumae DSM 44177]UWW09756.1 hypothetical protein L2Z93_002868 [Mycolicibacterium brumae]
MATTLTLDQMEELLAAHEEAEFNVDLEGTMATLVDNPVYELPALNYYIEGDEAVRETYRRFLKGGADRNIWAEKRTHAIAPNSLCREAYVYVDLNDGSRVTGRYSVIMDFEGTKISGERMFMDATFAKACHEIFGEDFIDVPGVEWLSEKSPAPMPRLDRAAVHAARPKH